MGEGGGEKAVLARCCRRAPPLRPSGSPAAQLARGGRLDYLTSRKRKSEKVKNNTVSHITSLHGLHVARSKRQNLSRLFTRRFAWRALRNTGEALRKLAEGQHCWQQGGGDPATLPRKGRATGLSQSRANAQPRSRDNESEKVKK